MLPQCYPNYKTVHRLFQTWCRSEVLRGILMDIANELRESGVLDEEVSFIDASFVMTKGGGAEVGPTKRGKGHENHGDRGSPRLAALGQHPRREPSRSAPRTIVLRLLHDRSQAGKSHRRPSLRQRPARPRVTSGWHRDDSAAPLAKPPTQDGRRLRRFLRRWLVERFFAWIRASWRYPRLTPWTLSTGLRLRVSPILPANLNVHCRSLVRALLHHRR